jgi:hypothetical protein
MIHRGSTSGRRESVLPATVARPKRAGRARADRGSSVRSSRCARCSSPSPPRWCSPRQVAHRDGIRRQAGSPKHVAFISTKDRGMRTPATVTSGAFNSQPGRGCVCTAYRSPRLPIQAIRTIRSRPRPRNSCTVLGWCGSKTGARGAHGEQSVRRVRVWRRLRRNTRSPRRVKRAMGLEPTTLSLGSPAGLAWIHGFRSTMPKPHRWKPLETAIAGRPLARSWHAGYAALGARRPCRTATPPVASSTRNSTL